MKSREELILESYRNREISTAYMLCLISDDCGRCTTCHIDNEITPVYFGDKSPVVSIGGASNA